MSRSDESFLTFATFGKSRKTVKTVTDIKTSIESQPQHGLCIKDCSVYQANGFWGDICKDLQLPNTSINRLKIRKAYVEHLKGVTVNQDGDLTKTPVDSTTPAALGSDDDHGEAPFTPAREEPGSRSPSLPEENVVKHHKLSSTTTSDTTEEDECGFFKKPLPPKPWFFWIEKNEWEVLERSQIERHFKGLQWTNVISKGIKSVQPYCSFGFKRHYVKMKGSSRTGPLFTCTGYCRFSDCPVNVSIRIEENAPLKAHVDFTGQQICHSSIELKRRPVRAESRQSFNRLLECKLPRATHLESLQGISEDVMLSGCRDGVPTPAVLRTIGWSCRQAQRPHSNELLSLQKIIDKRANGENEVLQKVLMHPKGIMLWSKKTIAVFYKRCKEDIVYLDATGSIVHKEKSTAAPYYVYELVVRNQTKGASPFPVATYVTCDHTTASVTYFLLAFLTDVSRQYGQKASNRPVMIICDGSLVLLRAISMSFCRMSLEELLEKYQKIITGQHSSPKDLKLPILHRCLSHIMKNAKDLCKKHAPHNYRLAMHVMGLLACSTTLQELDVVVHSAAVLFSSPCAGKEVEKHLNNLELLMQQRGIVEIDPQTLSEEDFKNDVTQTPLLTHFEEVINSAPLMRDGPTNPHHCPSFIPNLWKYFLPHATLWSGVMLGNLGRHGSGPAYVTFGQMYERVSRSNIQNFTQDNRTQGVMEKSQWDLKQIRFQRKKFTRLDDFALVHQKMHNALLREYEDTERQRQKTYRVETEKWKEKTKTRKGIYVSPLKRALPKTKVKIEVPDRLKQKKIQLPLKDHEDPPERVFPDGKKEEKFGSDEREVGGEQGVKDYQTEKDLWVNNNSEMVIAVVESQDEKGIYTLREREFNSLAPHNWLIGETIECYIRAVLNVMGEGKNIFLLDHYSAGVIVKGDRSAMSRFCLPKVNFENHHGVIAFYNVVNHWKLLFIHRQLEKVFVMDPLGSDESTESTVAADRFRQYFKMRQNRLQKKEWTSVKWQPGMVNHSTQQDGCSCGVFVMQMAKTMVENFPAVPKHIHINSSRQNMKRLREEMGKLILQCSVFRPKDHCSNCGQKNPAGTSKETKWIECTKCKKWFHSPCVAMGDEEWATEVEKQSTWTCGNC